MTVWLVMVNGKVDGVYATSRLATDRMKRLQDVNGDQCAVYCQEQTVKGSFEESVE